MESLGEAKDQDAINKNKKHTTGTTCKQCDFLLVFMFLVCYYFKNNSAKLKIHSTAKLLHVCVRVCLHLHVQCNSLLVYYLFTIFLICYQLVY